MFEINWKYPDRALIAQIVAFGGCLGVILVVYYSPIANANQQYVVGSFGIVSAIAMLMYVVLTADMRRFWLIPGFALGASLVGLGLIDLFLAARDAWLPGELVNVLFNHTILFFPYAYIATLLISFLLPHDWYEGLFGVGKPLRL